MSLLKKISFFRKAEIEERIQAEIRRRVLEESINLQDEKQRLEEEKINLDVLEEMSELSGKRIKEIAAEVHAEFGRYSKPKTGSGHKKAEAAKDKKA